MAYVKKYEKILYPFGSGAPVYIEIHQKDYSGTIDTLAIPKGGVTVIIDPTEYFDVLVGTSVEIKVINNKTNFFELDELFSISDFEFYVKVHNGGITFFEGFIPCEVVEQKLLSKGIVTINATNNLKRLSEFVPTLFTVKGLFNIMDIIKHCLSFTGLNLPIWVNCSLYEVGDVISDNSTFDTSYLYSDLFLKNDVEYEDCKVILESILKSFDCKIYYWNGRWYIERVKDLGNTPRDYVVYRTNGTVVGAQESNAILTISNVEGNIRYINRSQVLSYVPGVKQVKINLKEKERLNLVNYYYDQITMTDVGDAVEQYHPDLNQWQVDRNTNVSTAFNYFKMTNAVLLEDTYSWAGTMEGSIEAFGENISAFNYAQKKAGLRASMSGLFTRVHFDINQTGTTTLTVKFKFKLPQSFFDVFDHVGFPYNFNFLTDSKKHPDEHKFYARIMLRNYDTNLYVVHNSYAADNGEDGAFQMRYRNDITEEYVQTYPGFYILYAAIIEKEITFANFTDQENFMTEVTVDIKMDDVDESLLSSSFILGILEIGYTPNVGWHHPDYSLKDSIFGDIVISVNVEDVDNVHTGSVSNDFVDTLEEDILVYDSASNNILNSIHTSPSMDSLSSNWKDAQGTTTLPLVKKMIEDRYQLYHYVRRELTTDFNYTSPLKPFTLVSESHFINDFYVNGYRWVVDENTYKGGNFKEYVTDDDIT